MELKVRIDEIDVSDDKYLFTFPLDFQKVKRSIEKVGLLSNPSVERKEGGGYRIVTGFKRIYALNELKTGEIKVELVENNDRYNTALSIYDNITHRVFNPVEKGLIISKLLKYFSREENINYYLELIGVAPSAKALVHYEKINLLSDFKDELASGSLNEWTAESLLEFEPDDARAVVFIITKLKLGVNSQREIIENLLDISKGEVINPCKVLKTEEVQAVLSGSEKSAHEKWEFVREVVMRLRYPKLSSMKEEFNNFITDLKLPENMKLTPPVSFEGSRYRMTIDFRKLSELKGAVKNLRKVQGNKGWGKFIKE